MTGNVLFIVIDQLRADCLRGALADYVPTPNLDRFANSAVVFSQHYTVTNPCGPARASLLTGLYAKHHGAVQNGVPLSAQGMQTNLALEMRKQGYEPLLFGYTDIQPDPASHHPNDPDLRVYENVLPGFRELVEMRLEHGYEWLAYLRRRGYDIPLPLDRDALYRPQGGQLGNPAMYRTQDSDTAYLTDRTIEALDIRRGTAPWFAHVTYIRPHPPLVAPAPWHELIDPDSLPAPIPRTAAPNHPFMAAWFSEPGLPGLFQGFDGDCSQLDTTTVNLMRATYLGLVAEVDHHLGRLLDWLEDSGQADDTLVIITADHGEMLGDYGLWGKQSVFPQAFHIPLLIRDPSGTTGIVDELTESTDIMPTILDWVGQTVPEHCDGVGLGDFLHGKAPEKWREQVFLELTLSHTRQPSRFARFFGRNDIKAEITATHRCYQVDFAEGIDPLVIEYPTFISSSP